MNMFEKYDNLNPDYIPDNSSRESTGTYTIKTTLPRVLYDIKKRFIGYTWSTDERFSFTLTVNDIVPILDDAIVYRVSGEEPDYHTVGQRIGQQAYNTFDKKSWTFVGKSDNVYMWIEDKTFTCPIEGDNYITIYEDMTDSYAQLHIYNFRWEPIVDFKSNVGEAEVVINVDDNLSEMLSTGVYYAVLKIVGPSNVKVKEKWSIVVT